MPESQWPHHDGAEPAVSLGFLTEVKANRAMIEGLTPARRDAYAEELARKHNVPGTVTGDYLLHLLKKNPPQ